MIAAVEGSLEGRGIDWALVKVGGVTLRVSVPASTLAALGAVGERVSLFTHLYVREDNLALYGFATVEELRMFEELLGVAGVGPKTALALLSTMSPERLAQAVTASDVEALVGVPGVGKKMASRLVLELKGKLEKVWAVPTAISTEGEEELAAALATLGYSAREVSKAVASLPPDKDIPLEEKVRLALQGLGRE